MMNVACFILGAGMTCVFVGPKGSGFLIAVGVILAGIDFTVRQARTWPK